MMSKLKNPHLPAAPLNALHSFQGPTDLGGNSRCTFCGAYQGSVEGEAPCRGEYRESGKMRSWAAEQWAIDRLSEGGPAKMIVMLLTRQPASHKHEGVTYISGETRALLLECGHERTVDYREFETAALGEVSHVACYVCAMKIEERDAW